MEDSRFERFYVSNYVREFRHGAILAKVEIMQQAVDLWDTAVEKRAEYEKLKPLKVT